MLGTFDRGFARDQRDFVELSRHVLTRDRHIIERSTETATIHAKVKNALAAARSTAATLKDSREKQRTISRALQELEDAVDPVYQRVEASFTQADRTRSAALDHALKLFDEVQTVEQKLAELVAQHNRSRSQMRSVSEVDRVVNLVDNQLVALEACAQLASTLEKELDFLLGKSA